MNKAGLIILVMIALVGIGIGASKFILNKSAPISTTDKQAVEEPTSVNITASFEIYTNGTKRIFTDSKYHNLSSDVYLESDNPGVVHVKKTGVTWDDFFKTLPMKLTQDCLTTGTGQVFCSGDAGKLTFLINNIEVPNALEKVINESDKLVVTYSK